MKNNFGLYSAVNWFSLKILFFFFSFLKLDGDSVNKTLAAVWMRDVMETSKAEKPE